MGIYSDWWYYKPLTITGSTAGAVTNYPIRLTVHFGAGTDSGSDIYLNGHAKTDFSDVRFCDDAETTEYSCWQESVVASDYAVFWVKIPSIGESPATASARIYYGNASASLDDDGDGVFALFDTFDGASIDTSKWSIDGVGYYATDVAIAAKDLFANNKTFSVSGATIQAIAVDDTYWYTSVNKGDGVPGDIVRYLRSTGAVQSTWSGCTPPHGGSLFFRPDTGDLLSSSGSTEAVALWEIDKDDGTVNHQWDLEAYGYSTQASACYKSSATIYLLTHDGTNFRISEITLNEDNTSSQVGSDWQASLPADIAYVQAIYWDGTYLYLVYDISPTTSGLHKVNRYTLDTAPSMTLVDSFYIPCLASESEGFSFYDGKYFWQDLSGHVFTALDGVPAVGEAETHGFLWVKNAASQWMSIFSKNTYSQGHAVGARVNWTQQYPSIGWHDNQGTVKTPADATNAVCLGHLTTTVNYLSGRQRAAASQTQQNYSATTYWADGFHRYEIRRWDGTAEYYGDGTHLGTGTGTVPTGDLYASAGLATASNAIGSWTILDWFYVRPYSNPEPTMSSGDEYVNAAVYITPQTMRAIG